MRYSKKIAVWMILGLMFTSSAIADSGTSTSLKQYPGTETTAVSSSAPIAQTSVVSTQTYAASADSYGQSQEEQPNFFKRVFGGFRRHRAPSASDSYSSSTQNFSSSGSVDFPKVQTKEDEKLAKKFEWWPTDAQPGPVKDPDRSGYWWWPEVPGQARPWGNQGFIYVRKIIFDYKTSEGPMKPSLIIKRVLKNVKVYFDYDKTEIRDDAAYILDSAMETLAKNPSTDILITGNCDTRGSEQYNLKLGEKRAEAVHQYLSNKGLTEARIRILSQGKLNAMAPKDDLVGMQRDRNAQFMIAEVEEVMIPADKAEFFGENQKKVIEEKQELVAEIKVDVKEYTIQKGDTLWAIAEREYGNGMQWKRLYEFNKDVITNPDKPRRGTKIRIPIE